MAIFKLEVFGDKPLADAGYQERAIIVQMLQRAAGAMSGAEHEGDLVYDGKPIGRWVFDAESRVYQEHTRCDGPGSGAAIDREAALRERVG
jgi:hypothetical protein